MSGRVIATVMSDKFILFFNIYTAISVNWSLRTFIARCSTTCQSEREICGLHHMEGILSNCIARDSSKILFSINMFTPWCHINNLYVICSCYLTNLWSNGSKNEFEVTLQIVLLFMSRIIFFCNFPTFIQSAINFSTCYINLFIYYPKYYLSKLLVQTLSIIEFMIMCRFPG